MSKMTNNNKSSNVLSEKILGVRVDFGYTVDTVLSKIAEDLKKNDTHIICTTNPEFILASKDDTEFKSIINDSYMSLPDGVGVLMAKKYLDTIKPFVGNNIFRAPLLFSCGIFVGFSSLISSEVSRGRLTGVTLSKELLNLANRNHYSVFLLGGWPKDFWGRNMAVDYDLAQTVIKKARKDYPNIKFVGGTSGFSPNEKDDSLTLDYISKCMKEAGVSTVDFILVAYGHSRQERWLKRNMSKIPAKFGVGVGGTFDYLSGIKKETPVFIQNIGMDWAFRLFTQPWRLKRIASAFIVFPIRVFLSSLSTH